jgi:hypothetical protein
MQEESKKPVEMQRIDLAPAEWPKIIEILDKVTDETLLRILVSKLSSSMNRNYSSLSWILLFVEYLQNRKIPIPDSVWSDSIKMSRHRVDLYGLLELFHLLSKERLLKRNDEYKLKLVHYSESNSFIGVDNDARQFSSAELAVEEWNTAFSYAYQSRKFVNSETSYQEGIMEVCHKSLGYFRKF